MANIMLVEDDGILVEMYQAKFEIEGHEIVVATNGQECLNLLEDYVPDIILLDILMPKLNGFLKLPGGYPVTKVTLQIRRREELASIYVSRHGEVVI